MSDRIKRARGVLDHVERHDLEDIFHGVDVTFAPAKVLAEFRNEVPQLAALLRWVETLTDPTINAIRSPVSGNHHMHVVGAVDGGVQVDVYVIAVGAENELVAAELRGGKTSVLPLHVFAELANEAARIAAEKAPAVTS